VADLGAEVFRRGLGVSESSAKADIREGWRDCWTPLVPSCCEEDEDIVEVVRCAGGRYELLPPQFLLSPLLLQVEDDSERMYEPDCCDLASTGGWCWLRESPAGRVLRIVMAWRGLKDMIGVPLRFPITPASASASSTAA
jgi:hypothetical protein